VLKRVIIVGLGKIPYGATIISTNSQPQDLETVEVRKYSFTIRDIGVSMTAKWSMKLNFYDESF
jgi:hypothetical protein